MYLPGEVVKMPIAHGEGNYYADADTIERLKREDRIVFYYSDEKGNITDKANPNGSVENIAGILNEERNVLGMMPHPERCAEEILGNTDGKRLFMSILEYLEGRVKIGKSRRS
jgi:phosphoribosylformylglycinamidine synthase